MKKDSTNNTTTYTQSVTRDGDDLVLTFPEQLLKKLGWKAGDDLRFEPHEDGSFSITKIKMTTVELDLEEDVLFRLMRDAHENHITLDEHIQNIMKEFISQHE